MNLIEVSKKYADQRSCIQYLEEVRWRNGIDCPYCESSHISRGSQKRHHCNKCNRKFSVTVGTLFHNTKLPLPIWFMAICLILESKKGLSSRQLGRALGINKNTAWYLSMRVRAAMALGNDLILGFDQPEAFPSKEGRMNRRPLGRYLGAKHGILAFLQDRGRALAGIMDDVYGPAFAPPYQPSAKDHADYIIDMLECIHEGPAAPEAPFGLEPPQIDILDATFKPRLSQGWSLLRRGILGQFHRLSAKYFQAYIEEFTFRHHMRGMANLFQQVNFLMVKCREFT